jgi:phage FluMu protein Com
VFVTAELSILFCTIRLPIAYLPKHSNCDLARVSLVIVLMADSTPCPHCGITGGVHAERVIGANREAFIKSRCDQCQCVWMVSDGHERRSGPTDIDPQGRSSDAPYTSMPGTLLPISCTNCDQDQVRLYISSRSVLTLKCPKCAHAWSLDVATLPAETRKRLAEALLDP